MESIELIFIAITLLAGIFVLVQRNLPKLLAVVQKFWRFSRLSRKLSFAFLPVMFTSLGIGTLVKGLISLMLSFFKILMNGIGSMFSDIFAGFGNSVVIMLQSFGFSTASYGILGPAMFVIGLALAFLIGYGFLVPTKAEEDVVQDEDDL